MKPIPYGRQQIDDADVRAVVECLGSDFLTQGPTVARFERALADQTGAKYAVAVSNGTAALHLAYLALGIGPGDVGVTSPISFVATSNGLLYAGASVAFADVDPATGLLTEAALSRVVDDLAAAGRAPRVITPVDLAGQPADRAMVRRIADRCGARIVEDAAHSLGAAYELDGATFRVGQCAHADAAIFSFHPVKHITTAEGGAVLVNDEELYRTLLDLRSHGVHKDPRRLRRAAADPFCGPWYYEQSSLGFNYRITDLQCALGLSQLARLDSFVARRREIAARYDTALGTGLLFDYLTPARRHAGRSHSYHLYVVQLRRRPGEDLASVAERRKRLYSNLLGQGVQCQVHYIPIPWQPYYRESPLVIAAAVPGAEEYYATSLSIPMFPGMTNDDVDAVIVALQRGCAG